MYDWIIVAFVAIWIFFMIRRGGCCGGHSHGEDHQGSSKGSCCHGHNNNPDEKQNENNNRKEL